MEEARLTSGLLNNQQVTMGKENTFQVRTNLERRKHKAYLESDEWLGVQSSVGGGKKACPR